MNRFAVANPTQKATLRQRAFHRIMHHVVRNYALLRTVHDFRPVAAVDQHLIEFSTAFGK